MSKQYDLYLLEHKANVCDAFQWLQQHLPMVTEGSGAQHNIVFEHDVSKFDEDEYDAYDNHFYGSDKSHKAIQEFNRAWLIHIHKNPHHWQYWVLINDDPKDGEIILDIPYKYIIEMICDWWSFSWKKGNLYEIFDWYKEHKVHMKLSVKTQSIVEDILLKMRMKLDELKDREEKIGGEKS